MWLSASVAGKVETYEVTLWLLRRFQVESIMKQHQPRTSNRFIFNSNALITNIHEWAIHIVQISRMQHQNNHHILQLWEIFPLTSLVGKHQECIGVYTAKDKRSDEFQTTLATNLSDGIVKCVGSCLHLNLRLSSCDFIAQATFWKLVNRIRCHLEKYVHWQWQVCHQLCNKPFK